MGLRSILFVSAAACALPVAVAAQPVASAPREESLAPLVVQALPLGRSAAEVATPVIQLGGEELVFQRRATLGDTLSSQPGISSDTFGGGASRPVIRGQSAPRVKVLSDSSELLDASQVSPDHAVTAEPLLIDEIEVLRGPSALLYGGGAIGGAVNLIDKKVPTRPAAGGFEAVAEGRLGTNADERSAVAGVTAGSGPLVFHAEGVVRRSDDYKAGGDFGRVAGSYNDTDTGSIGASWVGAQGYLGLAWTRQSSRYGLAGHDHAYEECHLHGLTLHCGGHDDEEGHDHEHAADEAPPSVDLDSDRLDVRGEYRNPLPGVARIRLRGGATRYRHHEIEDGAPVTTFRNKGWDGRVEVEHSPLAGWRGVLGVQTLKSDFSTAGEEAFLPTTKTRTTGLFLLEERTFGPVRIELAARQEWQEITPQRPSTAPGRSHSPFSASASAIWSFAPGYSLAFSYTRSQRAPSTQELYAEGVHLATSTYELGDDTLRKETSNAADVTLRKTSGGATFTASAYLNRISGYVWADTLDQFEGFRLIRYTQSDARFYGFDLEVRQKLSDSVAVSVFADAVRGRLTGGGGDLPRIPAARLGAHLDYATGPWTAEVEAFHVFRQERTAGFETQTPGYEMVNLTLAYALQLGRAKTQLYLRAANLFDALAYNHTSFIKSAAPLTGRTFTLGLRAAL